jgi:CheY-like chemotaxis protein
MAAVDQRSQDWSSLSVVLEGVALASRTSPCRVLVVEDEGDMAVLVQVMLASDDRIEVVGRARHGREALTMAASLDPDVILMDLQMPVMDGVEATRRLRDLRSTARIIVLTGVEDAVRIRYAREAGADAFVTKIPTREHFVTIVLSEGRTAWRAPSHSAGN